MKNKIIAILIFNIILFGLCCVLAIKTIFIKNVNSAKNTQRPKIIGIVATYELDKNKRQKFGDEHGYLWDKHFIRARYTDQFAKVCKDNNVSFVIIPPIESQLENYVKLVDGVIFTGGDDMDAKYFGQKNHPAVKDVELDKNIDFQISFYKKLVENNKHILGICLGEQIINVAHGGDLIQDIPSTTKTDINHKDGFYLHLIHTVNLKEGSLLREILNKDQISVNSNHHQAVGRLGKGISATGIAPDGIIEAIEKEDYPAFLLGVQWHLEANSTPDDTKIIKAFCDSVENGR